MGADRAVLEAGRSSPRPGGAVPRLAAITARLDGAGVAWGPVECDGRDLHSCLRAVVAAVRRAVADGDRALVSISTGGRLLAHAAALAAMMWGAEIYCAVPGGGPVDGPVGIIAVPCYKVEMPPRGTVECLRALASVRGCAPMRALQGALRGAGVPSAAPYERLDSDHAVRKLVDQLVRAGLVESSGRRQTRLIHITEEGRKALREFDERYGACETGPEGVASPAWGSG